MERGNIRKGYSFAVDQFIKNYVYDEKWLCLYKGVLRVAENLNLNNALGLRSSFILLDVMSGKYSLMHVRDKIDESVALVVYVLLKIEHFDTYEDHKTAVQTFVDFTDDVREGWVFHTLLLIRMIGEKHKGGSLSKMAMCYLAHAFLVTETKLLRPEIANCIIEEVKNLLATTRGNEYAVPKWAAEDAETILKNGLGPDSFE
jgi:hypothetical protein